MVNQFFLPPTKQLILEVKYDNMHFINPEHVVQVFGIIGVLFIVYAETGLLVGFFLPGDSLLFAAGIFAAQGYLSICLLIIGGIIAAFLGDQTGYFIGRKFGPKIFAQKDSFFFKKRYVEMTQRFYEEYGKKTIVIARFVPIVRTFAPVFAGVVNMDRQIFTFFNILGGIFWVIVFSLLGYFLGNVIGHNTVILGYITGGIIFFSIAGGALQFLLPKQKTSKE